MALDNPEDEVSPLWEVAISDGKYRECPYLQSNRQGQCSLFRRYGPARCHICGVIDGLEVGYSMGSEDGYHEGRIDERQQCEFEAELAEEDRYAGMD